MSNFSFYDVRNFDTWSSEPIGKVNQSTVRSRHMQAMTTNWHQHDDSDEMFIVVSGRICIETNQGKVHLKEGESHVVNKGTLHRVITDGFVNNIVIDNL